MDKDWMEVTIITSSEAVEAVSGILYNTGVKGVSIEDPEDVEFKKKNPSDWDYFDESLLSIKEGAIIKAYYKQDNNFETNIEYIKKGIDNLEKLGIDPGKKQVIVNKVNEEDWENNWKKYYKPFKAGKTIVVKPMWEEYEKKQGETVIELDPGMAFGTGTHETTRMCIKALEKSVKKNNKVFDIGTGSGILAIAASKLGAQEVYGVDLDPVAVKSAKENVGLNNIQNVHILHGDLANVLEGKADIVVSNIIADVIIMLCDTIKNYLVSSGIFITSGIIKDRKDDVVNKLTQSGFKILDINSEGEWVCITSQMEDKRDA